MIRGVRERPARITRVLLVNANISPPNDYKERVMPTELDYLASELEHRRPQVKVSCLDLALEGAPFALFSKNDPMVSDTLYQQRLARLQSVIDAGEYDLIGISFRNLDHAIVIPDPDKKLPDNFLPQLDGIMTTVARAPHNPYVVMGGAAYSLFPHELLERWNIDFGVSGPGEAALPWLVENINAGHPPAKGLISRPFDFSSAQFRRGYVDLPTYLGMAVAASVQTKRGCAERCIYCNYPVVEGRRYQLRSPQLVVDEIAQLHQEFGFQAFYLVDSVFNWPIEHAKAIMREIIRRQLGIRYNTMVNPKGIDEEFVDLALASGLFTPFTRDEVVLLFHPVAGSLIGALEEAKEDGNAVLFSDGHYEFDGIECPAMLLHILAHAGQGLHRTLTLGIDSGDEDELQVLGKGFGIADIRKTAAILARRKLPFRYDFLFGGPTTSEQSIHSSMQLAIETGAAGVTVGIGIRVYPQTALAQQLSTASGDRRPNLLPFTTFPSPVPPERIMEIVNTYRNRLRIDYNFSLGGLAEMLAAF